MVAQTPKQAIHDALQKALKETFGVFSSSFVVEHPADLTHGDYASNIALLVAKEIGESPHVVAERLAGLLEGVVENVASIDIAGPGFLNFTLDRAYFSDVVSTIQNAPHAWGSQTLFKNEYVLIEYTSPNLFKPVHVGNLVGNIIGESLARLYAFTGARVVRINYPSDIGLSVAKGVWGLRKHGFDAGNIHEIGKAYVAGATAYEEDTEAREEIEAVNRALYTGSDEELNNLRARGLETSREALDVLCAQMGTVFDEVIMESETSPRGKEIVREHLADGIFEESEGAIIYRGEKHGLHTRVFINNQGLPTYEAKDVGNFVLKNERHPDWSRLIIVTGEEQREYFGVVFSAIKEIFPSVKHRSLAHVPTGFLTLTTGKMSSRKGNVLTGEEILTELYDEAMIRARESRADDTESLAHDIATAALKYQILRHTIGSAMVFDKKKALSFEGASGPYLQYTHARIASVLTKAHNVGVSEEVTAIPSSPYAVERLLYQFPEIVEEAARAHEPHRIVTYATELASAFNAFYACEKIADAGDPYASYKMMLAKAIQATLAQSMYLLGFKAPSKM